MSESIASPLPCATRWRPMLSVQQLAFVSAGFFSLACNVSFWQAYTGFAGDAWQSPVLTIALATAIFGINAALLLVVLTRRTAKPVLTVLFALTAFAVYYMHTYRVYLDPDMVRNVLHTDAKESRDLISAGLIPWLLGYAVIPTVLLWRVRLRKQALLPRAVASRGLLLAGALLLVAGSIFVAFQPMSSLMRNHRELRHLITPGNFIVSTFRIATDAMSGNPKHRLVGSDARGATLAGRKPRLLVIVVGETVRAQNWGLNGYARNTTPQLAMRNVVNFRDVSACGSSTEVSLPCMFSDIGRANYDRDAIRRSDSVLQVLERAGVRTAWLDNQSGCKGVCAGLPFTSYQDAKDPALCDAERCLDEILVGGLARALRPGVDQVIVLHMLGNHGPKYFARYPPGYRVYQPTCDTGQLGDCKRDAIVNAYDNAIRYTDHVLAQLIDALAHDGSRDAALLYVSDHGESLGENNLYLHGLPYPIAPATQLKVPMALWLSPGLSRSRNLSTPCLSARARQPASHDNLFSSVLGLMDVRTKAYDRGLDLFAACISPWAPLASMR